MFSAASKLARRTRGRVGGLAASRTVEVENIGGVRGSGSRFEHKVGPSEKRRGRSEAVLASQATNLAQIVVRPACRCPDAPPPRTETRAPSQVQRTTRRPSPQSVGYRRYRETARIPPAVNQNGDGDRRRPAMAATRRPLSGRRHRGRPRERGRDVRAFHQPVSAGDVGHGRPRATVRSKGGTQRRLACGWDSAGSLSWMQNSDSRIEEFWIHGLYQDSRFENFMV